MRQFSYLILLCIACSASALADVKAIKADHIVMPESGEIIENKVILIEDGHIKDMVDTLPENGVDTVIDLSDKWVLPGLMDMHTHLTADITSSGSLIYDTINKSAPYRALVGAQKALEMLNGGFTTVRDIGNASEYADTALRKAITEGRIVGPSVYNSGKIISVFGGQTEGFAQEREGLWHQEYIDVVSPDDMRRAIHKNIYYGATFIKLVLGNHNAYTVDNAFSLSDESIRAAVDEAARANMKVAAHTYSAEQSERAVRAGVASIEHGNGISDETLKLMKKKGTYLAGTEFPARYLNMFENDMEESERYYSVVVDQLKRAYKIGTPLVFSTDLIMTYENEDRAEMAMNYLEGWVEAEIPPNEILKAMTINGAKLIGIEAKTGSIEKGKLADIIAVSQNPLDDIFALKEVIFVMKEGKRIR